MARDAEILALMVRIIKDTNEFNYVRWGFQDQAAPESGATVLLMRTGFDKPIAQRNSEGEDRQVNWRILLKYSHPEPDRRTENVYKYEDIIYGLFDHVSIGGLTMPRRTEVTRARDVLTSTAPTARILIEGFFTYRV